MEKDREKMRFFTLPLNTDTVASDFEEHLGHGLGKNSAVALKFRLWLCIAKEDLMRMENKAKQSKAKIIIMCVMR